MIKVLYYNVITKVIQRKGRTQHTTIPLKGPFWPTSCICSLTFNTSAQHVETRYIDVLNDLFLAFPELKYNSFFSTYSRAQSHSHVTFTNLKITCFLYKTKITSLLHLLTSFDLQKISNMACHL